MPFPAQFVRAVDYYYPTAFGPPAAREQPSVLPRKIFVFRQKRRLDSTTGASKTMQRILIFDDHPDSLRLVFGRPARRRVNPTAPQSPRWWDPVLGWMLLMIALILMFLPLFLKLRP
jgi:hypothetical protein